MVVSLLLLSRVMSSCKSLVAVPKGPLGTAQICWLTPEFATGVTHFAVRDRRRATIGPTLIDVIISRTIMKSQFLSLSQQT